MKEEEVKVERRKIDEQAKRKSDEERYSKRGSDFLYENGNKNKISAKKINTIMKKFVEESFYGVMDLDPEGGYLEYYLLHADNYTKGEILDYVMYFNTIYHITHSLKCMNLEESNSFDVEKLFLIFGGWTIFNYVYTQKFFIDWQNKLFKILTLQELPEIQE